MINNCSTGLYTINKSCDITHKIYVQQALKYYSMFNQLTTVKPELAYEKQSNQR